MRVIGESQYTHKCNAKVSTLDSNAVITTCNNCSSKMKMSKCATRSVANATLEDNQNKLYKVTIFYYVLRQINAYTQHDATTNLADQLLLTYTMSHKNFVSSVTNLL